MPAQTGRSFLLKDGTAAAGTTLVGARATSISVNGAQVDATTKDSNGMRELLAAGGVASLTITASGLLQGNAQATTLIARAVARSLDAYGIVFDNGDRIDGSFQLTRFEAGGPHDDAQTYDLTLESSGAITVTAA